MGSEVMSNHANVLFSLSHREREGARLAQPSGKGEGSLCPALTRPPLRGSLPLPEGEGMWVSPPRA